MKRTLITPNLSQYPKVFHAFMEEAQVYDSSCSQDAHVWFLDGQEPLYLKSAAAGSLQTEAALTQYFYSKQLSTEVLQCFTADRDWLLTRAIPGEDCTFPKYCEDPKRLCDTTAQLLRTLHEMPAEGCPIPNRTAEYLETARQNYLAGKYDVSLFPDNWGYRTPEEAWADVQTFAPALKADTLIHGDYCLPNIVLHNWQFSGFIDVDSGGVGDRHIDLFWGAWSLGFNLKTDRYRQRFFDAYGRDQIELERLRTVAAFEVFG